MKRLFLVFRRDGLGEEAGGILRARVDIFVRPGEDQCRDVVVLPVAQGMERLGDAIETGELDNGVKTGLFHGEPPFWRFDMRFTDHIYYARKVDCKFRVSLICWNLPDNPWEISGGCRHRRSGYY